MPGESFWAVTEASRRKERISPPPPIPPPGPSRMLMCRASSLCLLSDSFGFLAITAAGGPVVPTRRCVPARRDLRIAPASRGRTHGSARRRTLPDERHDLLREPLGNRDVARRIRLTQDERKVID